jgi:hypothetical protein
MDGFDDATYQRMVFIPTISEYPGRVLNTGNVRKQARVTGTTLGQSDEGDSLSASNPSGTPITLTPVGRYVYCAWSENEDAQVEVNLDTALADGIEQGLAETTEAGALALVTSLTQTMSQAAFDATMVRQAVGRLVGNMNGSVIPGDSETIYMVATNTQYPALMGITEFTHADVRGDSENPSVKGIWGKGGGVNLKLSTVVTLDANGWHNVLYVKMAFVAGWNLRSRIKRQDLQLQNRVIAYNNSAFSVRHDLRAIALRTTASQL